MSRWHTTEFDLLPERAFQPRGWKGSMTLEGGGKGSSAPPPNPALVAEQIESMRTQRLATNRMMSFADEMEPTIKESMRLGLATSKTAWDQSQADRDWMLGRRGMLTGLQDKAYADAAGFNEEGRGAQLIAEADADINAAASNARDQSFRGLTRRGGNPYGASAAALDAQTNLAQTAMAAKAHAMARSAAKQEGLQLSDRASNMLAGYPSMAAGMIGQGAQFGSMGLQAANSGQSGLMAGQGAYGSMAGQIGQNATGMYNAQANYKSQQDQIASANDPWNTILGAAAGGAGAFGMNYAMKKWG